MEKRVLNNHPVFKKLDSFKLKNDEYIIMGSGIIFALDIKPIKEIKDIDILVSPSGWEKIRKFGKILHNNRNNTNSISFMDGKLCIYDKWDPKEFKFRDIYKDVCFIDNYPFQSLESLLTWKRQRGKKKDKIHIKLVEKHLKKKIGGPEGT